MEPFLIDEIVWDQDNGKIEFVCFPDFEAASTPLQRTDEDDGTWAAIQHYHAAARQSAADNLVLSAVISDEHARVESVLDRSEYEQVLRDMQSELDEDARRFVDNAAAPQTSPTAPQTSPTAPQTSQGLPPEIAVHSDAE